MSRRRANQSPKSSASPKKPANRPAKEPAERPVEQSAEQSVEAVTRPADRPARTPATLYAAGAVVGLEALGAAVAGGWLTVEAIITRPRGLGIAASAGVFVLACGVGLGFLAWGLMHGRRWSRGPVVAIQLLMLPLGYELLSGSTTVVGAAMLVAAILTLVLVLVPPSTAVFRE